MSRNPLTSLRLKEEKTDKIKQQGDTKKRQGKREEKKQHGEIEQATMGLETT